MVFHSPGTKVGLTGDDWRASKRLYRAARTDSVRTGRLSPHGNAQNRRSCGGCGKAAASCPGGSAQFLRQNAFAQISGLRKPYSHKVVQLNYSMCGRGLLQKPRQFRVKTAQTGEKRRLFLSLRAKIVPLRMRGEKKAEPPPDAPRAHSLRARKDQEKSDKEVEKKVVKIQGNLRNSCIKHDA